MSKRPLVGFCVLFCFILYVYLKIQSPWWQEISLPSGECILAGKVIQKEYKIRQNQKILVLYLEEAYLISSQAYQTIQQKESTQKWNNRQQIKEYLTECANIKIQEKLQIICYMKGAPKPLLDQYVILSGKMKTYEEATNPGAFDGKKYYQTIKVLGSIEEGRLLYQFPQKIGVRERLYQIKNYCSTIFDTVLNEKDSSVMKSLLLGERGELDTTIKEVYQQSGMMHILAISGLHIALLGMGVMKLLRKLYFPLPLASICSLIFILLYGSMTGFGVSVIRAVVMFLLHMIAQMIGRTYDLPTALAISAILILMEQPLYLFHSGFLMSFGAVLSILLIAPILDAWRQRIPQEKIRKLLAGLPVSLAVFIGTLPVQLSFYYQISLLSVLLNLLILPCMTALMLSGLLTLLGTSIWIPLGFFPAKIVTLILKFYEMAGSKSLDMPLHQCIIGKPAGIIIFLYYAVLLITIYLFEREKNNLLFTSIIFLFLISLLGHPIGLGLKITAIDVGQGDGFYVTDNRGTHVLIDGGSSTKKKVGEYQILPYLKSEGASKLDGIFISHLDNDHYNGILELLEFSDQDGIPIEGIYLPKAILQNPTESLDELQALCNQKGVPLYGVEKGMVWKKGALCLNCIYPDKIFAGGKEDTNENSMVLLLTYLNFDALFTGDLEGQGEAEIADILSDEYHIKPGDIELLKIAHHGSKNSTSLAFIDAIKPAIGIISAGKKNSYGHPHQETLDRLEEADVTYYQTKYGAVIIKVLGERIEVQNDFKTY